jgi:hypothetical protein
MFECGNKTDSAPSIPQIDQAFGKSKQPKKRHEKRTSAEHNNKIIINKNIIPKRNLFL